VDDTLHGDNTFPCQCNRILGTVGRRQITVEGSLRVFGNTEVIQFTATGHSSVGLPGVSTLLTYDLDTAEKVAQEILNYITAARIQQREAAQVEGDPKW
jgi:hypothetical protein